MKLIQMIVFVFGVVSLRTGGFLFGIEAGQAQGQARRQICIPEPYKDKDMRLLEEDLEMEANQ